MDTFSYAATPKISKIATMLLFCFLLSLALLLGIALVGLALAYNESRRLSLDAASRHSSICRAQPVSLQDLLFPPPSLSDLIATLDDLPSLEDVIAAMDDSPEPVQVVQPVFRPPPRAVPQVQVVQDTVQLDSDDGDVIMTDAPPIEPDTFAEIPSVEIEPPLWVDDPMDIDPPEYEYAGEPMDLDPPETPVPVYTF